MQTVKSSSIDAIGHDPVRKILKVRFKSGETYHFADVSAAQHAALITAKSVGAHFQKHIRDHFKGTKAKLS